MEPISPDIKRGYDPLYFSTNIEKIVKMLTDHLAQSLEGSHKVLVQKEIEEVAQELNFSEVIKNGDADIQQLVKVILANSNRLHHPLYMGHQVAVPMVGAAFADLINGATNNSMPVYEMGPAASAIERKVVEWALSKLNWDKTGAGVMTHGGSMANLTCMLAARAHALPNAWKQGVSPNVVIMVPQSSHYSLSRAAAIMGLGTEGVAAVPVDEFFRIRTKELTATYDALVADGKKVIAVVANSCATATGMFDDLTTIGQFCRDRDIWFHVDGAHGAPALITEKYRHLLAGCEFADSVTWDTHKMMATSSLCGMALFRSKSSMLKTFSQDATYIFNQFDKPGEDISVNTLECTKSMMSLKLFFNLAVVGETGLAKHIEALFDHARIFSEQISRRPGFSVLCAPDANIICFRYGENCALQDSIRQRLVREGDFYITRATIHGKSYLRLSIMNVFTTEKHIDVLCDRIIELSSATNSDFSSN
jgi:L-2,4-diaminobutyrate decarboxylase